MSITVDVGRQRLVLEKDGLLREWAVSTGLNGVGQRSGSLQTPLGQHIIRARIGDDLPARAVLKGRRFTGEVWTPELHQQQPGRDWVLGRILWLCGKEPGFNRLGEVDTQRRYIYIHGTPDSEPMGVPMSHGCVRMNCDDLLELYPLTCAGMTVTIHE
ncbi:L,D-transpeptidase [Sansalvadorimonas verongulae]|uniref:L,D-transpeptidase n=1 Tax=Sansalvadorimonas verongulae TaxID=2172824 RepID=UPI0012BB540C|nr:L,D-transpeptidase [Sansalvadorimonas verongulae]MTI14312.1 murein L,D-transpeptidase [Sansalvadorimonas verongulae]